MLKINQGNHLRLARLWYKGNAVDHPAIYFVECGKVTFPTSKPHGIQNLTNFICGQLRIRLAQKLFHIIDIQHFPLGAAGNVVPGKVAPAFGFQVGKKGRLIF